MLQMLRIRIGLIIQTMIAELSLALSASRVDPKTKDEAKIWTTQVSARSTLTVRKYGLDGMLVGQGCPLSRIRGNLGIGVELILHFW